MLSIAQLRMTDSRHKKETSEQTTSTLKSDYGKIADKFVRLQLVGVPMLELGSVMLVFDI
jgi:hypothetical protein